MSRVFTTPTAQTLQGSITAFTTADWTMGGWYKPNSAGGSNIGGMQFHTNGTGPGTAIQRYQIGGGGTLIINANAAHSTTAASTATSTTMSSGAWNCVIVTYTASDKKLRVYMGTASSAMTEASYSSQTAGVGTATTTGTTAQIGDRQQADFDWDGLIARVFATQRLLTTNEMERFRCGDWTGLFAGGVTPNYVLLCDQSGTTDIANNIAFTVSGATLSGDDPPGSPITFPIATKQRRFGLPPRRSKQNNAPAAAQAAPTPPAYPPQSVRRRVSGLLRRKAKPVDAPVPPPAGSFAVFSTNQRDQKVRVRRFFWQNVIPADTNVYPTFIPDPSSRRRRAPFLRRGKTVTPTPVQAAVAAPAYPPQAVRRRVAGLLRRRGATVNFIQAQQNPPFVPPTINQRRVRGLLARRAHTTNLLPEQTAPPATTTRHNTRGLVRRRVRRADVVPAQDQPFDLHVPRRRGLTVRRARRSEPPVAQVVPPNPAITFQPMSQRRMRGLVVRRTRGTTFIPASVAGVIRRLAGLVTPTQRSASSSPTQTSRSTAVNPSQKQTMSTPAERQGLAGPSEKQGQG